MKKKIIFIAESINVNDSSCTKCNVALIQNMALTGHDVIVYHYTRRPFSIPNIDCRPIKEIKWSVNYILSKSQGVFQKTFKIYLHIFFEKIFGFSFTLFNDVNSIKRTINEVIKLNPDLIITVSKGTSFRPHYAMLSFPEIQHKWLANIHDPYPFHFNPRPYNWVEPGYAKKEKWFGQVAEKAKYSSFPSQLLKEWMGSYFPNFLKSGVVIPHQISEQKRSDAVLPAFFDASKFNLLHAGVLMRPRSPKGLLEAYSLFLKNTPSAQSDSCLLLLGPVFESHIDLMQNYSKDSTNIFIQPYHIPFDLIYKLQKQVSVNIILEAKSEISPFLPGKFPHCIGADKPLLLLSPYYSETKRLLGNDYEYWSEIDDVEAITSHIQKMYTIWKQDKDNFLLNRKDLIEYCSENHLKKVIDELLS